MTYRRNATLTRARSAISHAPLATRYVADGAVQAERVRVARELHDTIAQTLYSISIGASRVLTLLEQSETSQLRHIMEDLLQQATTGQAELRAFLGDLRAQPLREQEATFNEALGTLAANLVDRAGCQVRLTLADETSIAPATRISLVRIVREATHNIAKHARATQVDILLEESLKEVNLVVSDNGIGFDPSRGYPGHFGLQSMREHAQSIGAELEVISALGQGTRVRVRLDKAWR